MLLVTLSVLKSLEGILRIDWNRYVELLILLYLTEQHLATLTSSRAQDIISFRGLPLTLQTALTIRTIADWDIENDSQL
jgi:hypothetical protein